MSILFAVPAVGFAAAAMSRPYADMQRNYMAAAAVTAAIIAIVAAPPARAALATAIRRIIDEWRPR